MQNKEQLVAAVIDAFVLGYDNGDSILTEPGTFLDKIRFEGKMAAGDAELMGARNPVFCMWDAFTSCAADSNVDTLGITRSEFIQMANSLMETRVNQ